MTPRAPCGCELKLPGPPGKHVRQHQLDLARPKSCQTQVFNICLRFKGTIQALRNSGRMGRDNHNLNIPSKAAFEIVARDSPVTADGNPDRSTDTNVRLAYGLQRLYEPVAGQQPDGFDYLLMLLRCVAKDRDG